MDMVIGGLTPPCGIVIEVEERTREKSAGVAAAGTGVDGAEPPWQPESRPRRKMKYATANALWGSATAGFMEREVPVGNGFSGFCSRMDDADGVAEPPCWTGEAGGTRYRDTG
jgi:hypothetical protein